MCAKKLANTSRTDIRQTDLEYTLTHLTPLNVVFIEKIRRLPLLKVCSPSMTALIIALLCYFPAYFWLIPQMINGEKVTLNLITFLSAMSYIFLPLVGSQLQFSLLYHDILKIKDSAFAGEFKPIYTEWRGNFSVSAQRNLMILFAVPFTIVNVLQQIVRYYQTPDQLFLIIGASTWLGIVFGLAVGNWLHFYLKISSVIASILTSYSGAYSLVPSETVFIRLVWRLTVRLVLVFASLAAVILFLYVAGYRNDTDLPSIIGFVVSLWLLMIVPILRTLILSNRLIREKKDQTLLALQRRIDQSYGNFIQGETQKPMENIDELLKLYDLINKSADFPVDLNSIIRIVVSFVLPLLSLYLQHLLNIK